MKKQGNPFNSMIEILKKIIEALKIKNNGKNNIKISIIKFWGKNFSIE